MIKQVISKTPLRISFAGGGTDIPQFFKKYGYGQVVSAAIDKYVYVIVSKHFYQDRIRVSYSKTENDVRKIDDIEHPVVREALKLLGVKAGLQIVSITDVHSRGTGLGSSSSFTVGILNALHAWKGEKPLPRQLAEEAIKIEREILNEAGGVQDQYMASFGGIRSMRFATRKSKITSIANDRLCELEERLLLFYTGSERKSVDIHKKQDTEVDRHLGAYIKMRGLAEELTVAFGSQKWDDIGRIMDENWQLKKTLSDSITNPRIERIYEIAKRNGAIGGKLIGAGGAGFMLFYAEPRKHKILRKAMGLRMMPFKFDLLGSRIIMKEKTGSF